MNKPCSFLLSIFLLYGHFGCCADAGIDQKIEQLIQKRGFQKSSLGIIVMDTSFNNIYALNPDKQFIPASLTKVASLSAFHHYYPHHLRFKTQLVSSAPIKNQELQGDLVFKGGADPSFTSENLWQLVNSLTRTGVKKIKGDIIIDNSLFKKSYALEYTDRSYTATASAASFNWNSITFFIRPAQAAGQLAIVNPELKNDFIKFTNKVKTVSSGKKASINLKRISKSSKGEAFILSGSIPVGSKEVEKYSNVQYPEHNLGYNLIQFLKEKGITVDGTVKIGSCSTCKVLAEFKSQPLHSHTRNMMKYSSNFIARMLTAYLPIVKGSQKGDLDRGMHLINAYLKTNLGFKNYRLEEPAGLSRDNKLTANHLKKLLKHDLSSFYNSEIFAAYPLAEGQGTLKKRFANKKANTYIRAKTGLLNGVGSLLGHAKSKDREIFFIFLFNGPDSKTYSVRNLFDDIIIEVI